MPHSVDAASDPNWFPFQMQWDDASRGVATDVSFLSDGPAGKNGYIVAKGGHFVESNTGRRLRFLGTNFTFDADFPNHKDAAAIAAHLGKYGINIVRIHHEDTNGGKLWNSNVGSGHTVFDVESLDRLDYLVSQLKANGIYVDLNLHVSRQFTADDGFPNSVDNLTIPYNKGIDNFNRRMIELNKEFARDYLTHVNPYTHLSYAEDPCVAIVEINNENSAVGTFGDYIETANSLPEPFRQELVQLWSAWLVGKYANVANFIAAWYPKNSNPQSYPLNVLSSANAWYLQDQTNKASQIVARARTEVAAPTVVATVPVASEEGWHTQDILGGLDLENDAYYVVNFRAKASTPRTIGLYAARDVDNWQNVGLSVQVKVGTDWADYQYTFQPSGVVAKHSRLAFALGADTGSISIDSVRITQAGVENSDEISKRFADQNVDIPVTGTRQALSDWHHFLADVERDYADEMRSYLRKEIGVHANLIDTQMAFGGISSFNREAGSDFADNHAYWQHPSFPGRPWDQNNWNIANTPMSDALASGEGGTFKELGLSRVAGKPFTVTEYNHPAPSDFRSEMFPEISTFASAQDWDGVFEFDYGNYGSDVSERPQGIQGFFAMSNDPAKEAFLPSAALIFRGQLVTPLSNVVTLRLSAEAPFNGRYTNDVWKDAEPQLTDLMTKRTEVTVESDGSRTSLLTANNDSKYKTFLSARQTDSGSIYTALGTGAVAASGYLGGQSLALGACHFHFPKFGNNFAALTLVSLDRTALNRSKHFLLTILGRAENTGMVWNSTHTSVGEQWGSAPVLVEGITSTVTIASKIPLTVWALGPTGGRSIQVPSTYSLGHVTFSTSPEYQAVWYEISKS